MSAPFTFAEYMQSTNELTSGWSREELIVSLAGKSELIDSLLTQYADLEKRLDAAQRPPAPTPSGGAASPLTADDEKRFTEWFARNYPGPTTIITDPRWHAPKIYRAAIEGHTAALLAARDEVNQLRAEIESLREHT